MNFYNDKIKVSIITVCYNSANTIRKTFDSIINQTYKNIQYIVVDGCSNDGTLSIIENYKQCFPFEFTYISEKDNGIYNAMNKGLKIANGKIVGIINSDDWYEKDAIENVVKSYYLNNCIKYAVFFGYGNVVHNNEIIKTVLHYPEGLKYSMLFHPSCFLTKRIYDDFFMFDEKYKCASDYDFIIRLYRTKKVAFIPIKIILSNFTIGGATNSIKSMLETAAIRKKYNLISNFEYLFVLFKCILYSIFKKM